MSSHKRLGPCPLCDEKILTAHPVFIEWWPKIKLKFPLIHISWAYRDQNTQDQFVALGKSNALYPTSAHNKVNKLNKPCARAIDLFEIGLDGVPRWHAETLMKVAEWLIAEGFPLLQPYPIRFESKGTRRPVADWPHFSLSKEVPQP